MVDVKFEKIENDFPDCFFIIFKKLCFSNFLKRNLMSRKNQILYVFCSFQMHCRNSILILSIFSLKEKKKPIKSTKSVKIHNCIDEEDMREILFRSEWAFPMINSNQKDWENFSIRPLKRKKKSSFSRKI